MIFRRFALALTPTALTGAGLAVLAVAGIGLIASANPEAVVTERFVAALEAPVQSAAQVSATGEHPISGSEAYWLAERNQLTADGVAVEPATWSAPLAAGLSIGDRITVPGGKDGKRKLEVVAIADVEPAPGTLQAHTGTTVPQIAITCRDLSTDDHKQLVTFVVPASNDLAASGKVPQTL